MIIESGMIVIWHGTWQTVPDGYYICDGNNGTPDLEGRLPFCGNFIEAAGSVAGLWAHDHPGTTFPHTHTLVAGSDIGAGIGYDKELDEAEPVVTLSDNDEKLIGIGMYYIMKA